MAGNPTPHPYWTPDVPVIRLTEQERTSYREQIRELVTGASLTFTWLIRQLSDEGLMTDKYEMLTFLNGCFLILRISESVIQYFNYLFCIFH